MKKRIRKKLELGEFMPDFLILEIVKSEFDKGQWWSDFNFDFFTADGRYLLPSYVLVPNTDVYRIEFSVCSCASCAKQHKNLSVKLTEEDREKVEKTISVDIHSSRIVPGKVVFPDIYTPRGGPPR